MVQSLGICLPMQGTWVQSLVWEDAMSHRATKPMHHNYGAHRLQLLKPSYPRARDLQTREGAAMRSACPATREEPPLAVTRESPHTAKIYCSQN